MTPRETLLAALCPLLLLAPSARAEITETPARDDWLGRDKALHYSVSVGLAGAGYVGGAFLFDAPEARLLTGAGVALGAGVAKELYDAGRGSFFSWKDLTWDVLGTATGLAVSWTVDRLFFRPTPAERPANLSLSVSLGGGGAHAQGGAGDGRKGGVSLFVVGGW